MVPRILGKPKAAEQPSSRLHQPGGVVDRFPRNVHDDLSALPLGGHPKLIPIDTVLELKGDRIWAQSDPSPGQEFHTSGLQRALDGKEVLPRGKASAGFKIIDR